MAESADDHPGVIAPPPLIVAAALVVGLMLDWLVPAYALSVLFGATTRIVAGVLLLGAGLAMIVAAGTCFTGSAPTLSHGSRPWFWPRTTSTATCATRCMSG